MSTLSPLGEKKKPTCSKSSNKFICPLVVGSTAPRVELFAARSFKSSSSRRFFFFSDLSNTSDFSRSKSIRASESYKIDPLNQVGRQDLPW